MRPELVIIQEKEAGERLDKWLARRFPDFSRQAWKNRVVKGEITLNGQAVSASKSLAAGDQVLIPAWEKEEVKAPVMESLPLTVLYEDEWFVILDKPAGLVVHPAPGHASGTLVNAILASYPGLSDLAGQDRPGIVHRLDKDTSGLLIVAKDDQAHAALSRQLSERQMEKHYLALAAGQMKGSEGSIDLAIGRSLKDRKKMAPRPDGRSALTHWTVLQQRSDRALLDVRLVTGRTHQIRVHMAAIGHPVLGDPLYAARGTPKAGRLMLHAWRLKFTHPRTGEEMRFEAPPEESFGYREAGEPWR